MFGANETDARLVARTRKGDVEAYNRLVSRWEKRLYNYLLRLLGNREDSLDLSQEAFLKAYQSIHTLSEAEKFPQWLFRIAHNLAYSLLRRPSMIESIEDRAEWERDGRDWHRQAGEDAGASRLAANPSRPVFGLEMEFAVTRALEALMPEQREAIVLKVYQGFSFSEIAGIISCPLSTVKSRIYAGFEQLRATLGAEPGTATVRRTAGDRRG